MNEEEIFFLSSTISHHLTQKLDDAFKSHQIPITGEQYKMMAFLWKKEGVSQQKVADHIHRNRATTGRMIDTLYIKKLIKRKADPSDKRVNLIFLTKKGQELETKAKAVYLNVLKASFSSISSTEQVTLKKILKKISNS